MDLLNEKEALKIEYEQLHDTIWQRTQVAWIVESILITGSLIVAFQSKIEHFPTSFLSLILVIVSFIFLVTTDKVDSINHERMREIGEKLGIRGPNRMFEAKIEGKWWWVIRRNSWYGLFTILASAYLFLLLRRAWVPIVTVISCVLVILIREVHDWIKRDIKKEQPQEPKLDTKKSG